MTLVPSKHTMKSRVLVRCVILFILPFSLSLEARLCWSADGRTIDTTKPWMPATQNVEAVVNAAPKLPVENLLEPVHTIQYDGDDNLIWAPNPDGKTWDVLPVYFQGYGGPNTLPIIDLGSGKVKVVNYPELTFHRCPYVLAPNGRIYISTVKRSHVAICIYDPSTNEMKFDAIPVPGHVRGETHPIVRSTDGMLFAGGGHSSQSAACIMIDPSDDSITDFGACGPSHKPSEAYNYSMGADDTHVYIASGKVPWYLVAVDRRTKQSTVLAKTANTGGIVVVTQDVHGVRARVTRGPGMKREDYWCHQGKLVPQTTPCPWDKTGTDWKAMLPPKPEISSVNVVPTESDKQAELWVRQTVPGVVRQHRDWTRFRYDVPLYPVAIGRLIEMPDGRIFGTAGSYTGHFIFDPANGKSIRTATTRLSHYATAVHDNKIWMCGYPASQLCVFECSMPCSVESQSTQPGTKRTSHKSPDNNPRLPGRLTESRCHKMYASAVGASGNIYFGGRWMRAGNGGGLGWWDPVGNKEAGIWQPFSNHQIGFMCASGHGNSVVISTTATKDTVLNKPTPKEGKLFIFDDAKREIVREIIVEKGVRGPGPVVSAGGNRVIGWTNERAEARRSILYGVDVESGEIAWKLSLPFRLPIELGGNQGEPWDFRLGPDGWIWTFMGQDARTLVRIDPRTVTIEGIAKVDQGGRLAFSESDVYMAGTRSLRRIKAVAGDQ